MSKPIKCKACRQPVLHCDAYQHASGCPEDERGVEIARLRAIQERHRRLMAALLREQADWCNAVSDEAWVIFLQCEAAADRASGLAAGDGNQGESDDQ